MVSSQFRVHPNYNVKLPAISTSASSSWYLDPLVALQKREVHLELMRHWAGDGTPARLLKTDLFEEANGEDQILFDTTPAPVHRFGCDLCFATAQRAARRFAGAGAGLLCSDVRHLALASESLDLIVSTSTLDHLDSIGELRGAIGELARTLKPGGRLVLTLDNPRNPIYWVLRLMSRLGWLPFRLGVTVSRARLISLLEQAGLEVLGSRMLIHNPRLISTFLFLGLRRMLGRHAHGPISWVLALCARLDRLPTRELTACFSAACARKPVLTQRVS
jgi:SAM-dependent methyltransferase